MPDYLTSVHPLLVHFPIALLATGALTDGYAAVRQSAFARRAAGLMLVLGVVALIPAYLTGRRASDALASPFPATQLAAASHADAAWWTLVLFIFLVAIRLIAATTNRLEGSRHRVIAALGLVALASLAVTAHRGGRLVYDLGAGVRPVREAPAGAFEPPAAVDPDAVGPTVGASGLRWEFQAGSEEVLGGYLQVLDGELPPARIESASVNLVLGSTAGIDGFYTLGPDYENLQVELLLDLGNFEGDLSVAHHVVDATTYDFLRLSGGSVDLGRVVDGVEEILGTSDVATPSAPFTLTAVGAATHFRGYVNDELVVHGHAPALPAGPVGIVASGIGEIRIVSLRVDRLEE